VTMSDGPMNGLLLGASGGFDNDEAIRYLEVRPPAAV
jgi:hypothetical protein